MHGKLTKKWLPIVFFIIKSGGDLVLSKWVQFSKVPAVLKEKAKEEDEESQYATMCNDVRRTQD